MDENVDVIAYTEGENKELKSAHMDSKHIERTTGFIIDKNRYFNTGVCIYSSRICPYFSRRQIHEFQDLLMSSYGDRAFINY